MSKIDTGIYNPEISNVAKESGGNLADIKSNLDKLIGFQIPVYDDIVLGYDGSNNLTSVIYKNGGIVVATLSLTYSGTNLVRIEKS
jgi:hypothetical protein